jgi:hypothetical protein
MCFLVGRGLRRNRKDPTRAAEQPNQREYEVHASFHLSVSILGKLIREHHLLAEGPFLSGAGNVCISFGYLAKSLSLSR